MPRECTPSGRNKHDRDFCEFRGWLEGTESATHLVLLYWLGEADRTQLRSVTRIDKRLGGVFANRSPARPNPIGISAVRLLSVEGTVVVVGGLDCLDRTPLLDMKPYIPRLDRIERAAVDWMRT